MSALDSKSKTWAAFSEIYARLSCEKLDLDRIFPDVKVENSRISTTTQLPTTMRPLGTKKLKRGRSDNSLPGYPEWEKKFQSKLISLHFVLAPLIGGNASFSMILPPIGSEITP